MPKDRNQQVARLRARVDELEAELRPLRNELQDIKTKYWKLDQVRNSDQDNMFSLQRDAATLRETAATLRKKVSALESECRSLRGLVHSGNYADQNQMVISPNFPPLGLDSDNNQGYVLMPFGPHWSLAVYDAVKKAFTEYGWTCQRADEETGRNIMHDVWQGICQSGAIIADITFCNPNVMYELGLADAIGKRIILISQTADPAKLAFDLRGLRLIPYLLNELPKLTADISLSLNEVRAKPTARL
jgi:cell division protein FtsB